MASTFSPTRRRPQQKHERVILLLDLDCFYAQCECRRLGLDAAEAPLAVLQWNSVLAVTYPARKLFGIARGDSWETVSSKSQGQCYAVHVPLLESATMSTTTSTRVTHTGNDADECSSPSLQQDYARLYQACPVQQAAWRQAELGKRRFSTEGKASIENYRVASAIIFETVQNWRRNHLQNQTHPPPTQQDTNKRLPPIVLERASIDEFFLDVTEAVHADTWWDTQPVECHTLPSGTVHVGQLLLSVDGTGTKSDFPGNLDDSPGDDSIYLIRGAHIARWIRQCIKTQLGFTLSAGIGMNKTIAKLSASHGKPDGQAVTFPQHVDALLDATPIRKCRNLGGKLGKAVAKLLPSHVEPNVGNIRKYFGLTQLQSDLPGKLAESASWVYRMANGQDDEPVQNTSDDDGALVQSITAFKAFPSGRTKGLTLDEAADWIELLTKDVVTRVERDAQRNHRYPRNCTVQYSLGGGSSYQSRSVRISFPPSGLSTVDKIAALVRQVPEAVARKEKGRLVRLGICATDFVVRARGQQGIESFVQRKETTSEDAKIALPVKTESAKPPARVSLDASSSHTQVPQGPTARQVDTASSSDSDLVLARKLQASYDREHAAWQRLDQRQKKRKQMQVSNSKISSFFKKR